MKNRTYTSFAEIDKDIQIARLERDIHREKVFLYAERVKNNVSISSLLNNVIGGGGQKSSSSSLIMSILNIALPFILNKFKK